jgi:molybdate-binding protein/DNA-binding XRE family transcriptional regulator
MPVLGNCVARKRGAAGLRQHELAARVGISRQRLSVLESGRGVPSAAVAIGLAGALGCKVEDLFWFEDAKVAIVADVALAPSERDGRGSRQVGGLSRVAVGSIDGRWVAHRLSAPDATSYSTAADGLLREAAGSSTSGVGRINLLREKTSLHATLLCAGCAPAFALLAARSNAGTKGDRAVWLDRSSHEALDLLARRQIHIAGAHLYDEVTGEFNVPFVERRFVDRPMLVFNLARWEAGLVVAAGNPRGIKGIADLARDDVTFVRRQHGSAAQALVERLLRREGLPGAWAARGRVVASGHSEVARLIALGVADAGVALAAVASPLGLEFIPLSAERFDLVLPKELAGDGRVARLLEALASRSFRREMESLGGHVVRDAGKLMARTAAHSNTKTTTENA